MNTHASLNRTFRLVWSHAKNAWCVAPETARGKGKSATARRLLPLALMFGSTAAWAELPQGGAISTGQGQLQYQDQHLTVHQTSDKLAVNWNSFSIGEHNSVEFKQPDAQSIALNRVLGADVSRIQGALKANGQVFLLNPNGVLFSPTAQVNTGGLVASTLELSDEDFLANHFQLEGDSTAAVINQGDIEVAEGGTIALIAATLLNEGTLQATAGNVLMGAGRTVTLDMGGPVKLKVDEGALNTLIEQGGAIRADGGTVYLTARAAGELASSVINHTGITRAQTLASGENGEIVLLGDMQQGQLQVAGTLDASAPDSGDGGFIETSAAQVKIKDEVKVTTLAHNGDTGEWLIDPTDFTVSAGDAAETISGIGAQTLAANLATNSITLETRDTGTEAGDIYVNAAVSWDAATTLTLDAHNNILINAPITVENSGGGVALNYGGTKGETTSTPATDSHYQINAPISFTAGSGGAFSVNGQDFTLIHTLDQLQDMNNNLGSHYALATDIDAGETQNWNNGEGFDPIGYYEYQNPSTRFTGTMDGLGHVITDLIINRPDENKVGLFGYTGNGSAIRNVGLVAATVIGQYSVGGLVGFSIGDGSSITQSYATGAVNGHTSVGGLVGYSIGGGSSITQSYATGEVNGTTNVGGLVGYSNSLSITQSYATGAVTGTTNIGGLVGYSNSYSNSNSNSNSSITQSYATGTVNGHTSVGGLVGYSNTQSNYYSNSHSSITQSYATGAVNGHTSVGGLVGYSSNRNSNINSRSNSSITQSYAIGAVNGHTSVGGLVGYSYSGSLSYSDSDNHSGSGSSSITQSYATGAVTGIDNVGGLVGRSESNSFSSSVGSNSSSIIQSYATGAVTGITNVGGLMGHSASYRDGSSSITQSYATGAVTGTDNVGGLVGHSVSYSDGSSSITQSYAASPASAAGMELVGYQEGTTIDDGSMKTLAELQQLYTFKGWDIDAQGGTGSVWRLYEGHTTPLLRAFLNSLALTAKDVTTTYTGTNQTVTGSWSADTPYNSDWVLGSVTASGNNADIYQFNLVDTYSDQQGYDLTLTNGTFTINKAPLTITAEDASKVYDGGAWSGGNGVSYQGLVESDSATDFTNTLTWGGTAQGAVDAKQYTLTASASEQTSNNYNITFNNGTLTIDQAPLTITAQDAGKVYDGLAWVGGTDVTYSGFVNGEGFSVLEGELNWGGTAQGAQNAGQYQISASGLSADNYAVSMVDGTLTIDQAPLTLTAQDAGKVYDGLAWVGGTDVTYSGFVNGEGFSVLEGELTWGGTAQGAQNAGQYQISASGLSADNYAVSMVDGTLTIDKAPLTITANDAVWVYDGNPWLGGNGVTYAGFVGDEDAAVLTGDLQWNGSAEGAREPGEYVLSPFGLDATNYTLQYADGQLRIITPMQAAGVPYTRAVQQAQRMASQSDASTPADTVTPLQIVGTGIRLPRFK